MNKQGLQVLYRNFMQIVSFSNSILHLPEAIGSIYE